jgi:hypothetical protein
MLTALFFFEVWTPSLSFAFQPLLGGEAASSRSLQSSPVLRTTRVVPRTFQKVLLPASPSDDDDDDDTSYQDDEETSEGEGPDFRNEETLLCVDLEILPGVDRVDAMSRVSRFCQSFPFAAVLPVQPLQYLPVYEDGGVELKFLRKKTDLKSGIDGGIRFFLDRVPPHDDNDNRECIEITAKRNSSGQFITKMMAEKLVITSFVSSIRGDGTSNFGSPPLDAVRIRSMYHKWM